MNIRSSLLLLASVAAKVNADESLVTIETGTLQGNVYDKVREFRGIPYAYPPLGGLRWQPPQPAANWSGVRDATQDGATCYGIALGSYLQSDNFSEDCLFVNVYTPRLANLNEPVPVMAYIHGGDYIAGGISSAFLYNGSAIAGQADVIVVTMQYRLAALGFIAINTTNSAPAPGQEITGSYGLMDQNAALVWIKNNIAAFGGDPTKVTLVGQSAGGVSVASHLILPQSRGLFRAAIIQSYPGAIPLRDAPTSAKQGDAFLKYANCTYSPGVGVGVGNWVDGVFTAYPSAEDCIRAQPPWILSAAQQLTGKDILIDIFYKPLAAALLFAPVIGPGQYLEQSFFNAMQNNPQEVADVPIIFGTVRDEAYGIIYKVMQNNASAVVCDLMVAAIFGLKNVIKIGLQYPSPPNLPPNYDYRDKVSKIATPAIFRCPARNATMVLAETQAQGKRKSSTYLYHFQHPGSFNQYEYGANIPICWDKACHSDELPFEFQPDSTWPATFTSEEAVLSQQLQSYWINFIINGEPGTGYNTPTWPAVTAGSGDSGVSSIVMDVDSVTVAGPEFDSEECNFWDSIGYNFF